MVESEMRNVHLCMTFKTKLIQFQRLPKLVLSISGEIELSPESKARNNSDQIQLVFCLSVLGGKWTNIINQLRELCSIKMMGVSNSLHSIFLKSNTSGIHLKTVNLSKRQALTLSNCNPLV